MAGGLALLGPVQQLAAALARKTPGGHGVEHLELGPLGEAGGARVLLLLVLGPDVDLHVLVRLVDAPLDGVDGLAVVDVVVGPADRAGLAGLHLRARVYDQEAGLSQAGAQLVQVLVVHLHQVGQVVVPQGRVRDESVDDEDLLRAIKGPHDRSDECLSGVHFGIYLFVSLFPSFLGVLMCVNERWGERDDCCGDHD